MQKKPISFVILKHKVFKKETFWVILKCNEKGWLREVWDIRPGALLKERVNADFKFFQGCLTEKVTTLTSDPNTDPVIIPGGVTSPLQAVHVVCNEPFRD